MAAMTLDHLSGGRFMLGLGASGPQVVEGWYGQPYPKPLARTREYVDIVRQIARPRDARSTYDGEHYQLPLPRRHRPGQAAEVDRAPAARRHPDLPRRRGPEERGPRRRDRRRLAADLLLAEERRVLPRRAWPRASPGRAPRQSPDDFEVAVDRCPSSSATTSSGCADFLRPILALYIGGMGAKGANFHFDVFARMGYEAECDADPGALPRRPQGRRDRRRAAGDGGGRRPRRPGGQDPAELPRWRDTCVTTLLVQGPPPLLEQIADVFA